MSTFSRLVGFDILDNSFFTLYATRIMEGAHPVPQNVTSFQFRLIGDMTLKQFGYLLAGVGLAYLMFVFLAAAAPLIAWPIIVISSFLGIAFAFLPIQDRPLDHWVGAFLKAIYSPTTRNWKKNGNGYEKYPSFKNRLMVYLTVQRAMAQPLLSFRQQAVVAPTPVPVMKQDSQVLPHQDFKPAPPVAQANVAPPPPPQVPVANPPVNLPPLQNSTQRVIASTPPSAAPTVYQGNVPPPPLPTSDELNKTVQLGREAQALQVKIIETEKQLTQIRSQATQTGVDAKQYTAQFNVVFTNLQALVNEANMIKKELERLTQEPQPKSKIKVEVVKPKSIPTPIVLTSMPNVINGIVVSAEGNYLDGVVVVIHGKDGLPVRALKTNKLGQFTGTTPLPNATYNVELEKEGVVFDVLQVELKGDVMPPLMISAKSAVVNP